MRKLVFFVGGAGAGKTSLAKALAVRHKSVVLDMDTLLRPAAIAIMTQAGLDPSDRDSAQYKGLCRDLGYRITMDAALENVSIGNDVFVIGPFTKETEDPLWLEAELSKNGASRYDVDVKVVFVYLEGETDYRDRIAQRGYELDQWKLDNWSEFRQSLVRRKLKWTISPASVLYFNNTEALKEECISLLEQFVYGKNDRTNK